ncbi:alkaline phosphatase family protein [Sphaerisporangium sp. NPDC051011]|uniref:alkaline phosphatase family protein n=1 Tax=Sphaerisporangium sp. NPDC051011 TaxID=3155792 RepID=UPI00340CEE62
MSTEDPGYIGTAGDGEGRASAGGSGFRPTRRRVLKGLGFAAGAAAVGGVAVGGADPAAAAPVKSPGPLPSADYVLPEGFTGTLADLKHVVILMQENRPFDQYFGQLPGVRGHYDKQALRFQDGTTVFQQPNGSKVVTPFHSASNYGFDHNLYGANGGRWNTWVPDKGSNSLHYYYLNEVPVHATLAQEFTVCDMSFCSVPGPTTPNRLFLWTGTSNGVTNNGGESSGNRAWPTYPEAMQAAGVSWRIYVDNTNNGDSWVGDYTDNPIRGFAAFTPSSANLNDPVKTAPGTGLVWRANSFPYASTGVPNNNSDTNLAGVLKEFIAACRPDAQYPLPDVSYIVAPYGWSEHPAAGPGDGGRFVKKVIDTLQANEELWKSTLLIITYDENDGAFDHVLPPRPEPGEPAEWAGSIPIGYGPRVPMILVSPWTRGGWVNSEVFDHTSVVRFLETWTAYRGTPAMSTTISRWRRGISGDLTSAIDFTRPIVKPLTLSTSSVPTYPAGQLKPLPLPFHGHGVLVEDRVNGTVRADLSVHGGASGKTLSMQVFPDKYQAFANTAITVGQGATKSYTWDVTQTDGKYAFSVYGHDGFVRSFAGQVVPAGQNNIGIPRVDVDLVAGSAATVKITLRNDGSQSVRYSLTANDYLGGNQTLRVAGGKSTVVEWPTKNGYYDVIITADTGTGWTQRYAGRVATI